MKSIINIGMFLMALVFIVSCEQPNSAEAENENEGANRERIFPVKTAKIQKETITRTLNYTANIVAFKEIYYAPAAPGRINKIHVEIGSRVKKGDLLVEMDRTQLNQAKTQLENARFNFQRIDTLYQLGSISEQTYEQTKTQYELAKSNVNFLIENTTLSSPIDGVVTGKYFENGEMYSGAPNTPVGKAAVIALMQINPLKAIVSISQQYFSAVKEGMEADVQVDPLPGKTFKGKVYKVYPTIDPYTRTFQVEVTIDNDNKILRPGMFGDIEIVLKDEETLLVPAIAILKQEGTNNRYVFVHENGTARQIEVTIGERINDKVELKADEIKSGMELIVQGQANLLNGSKVKVVK